MCTVLISYKDGENDKIWHLYSCGGEGTILEHNPEHLHGEAKNIDQLIKTTNDIKVPCITRAHAYWEVDDYSG
jgi:gem associated protein 5